MKILHINSYFSTGDFYKNFYDKQIENNINIDVFVPVSKSFHTNRDLGDYSFISRCYSQIDRYSFYVKQYKILKSIQNNFEIDSYDVIHAHSLFTNGYIAYKLNQKYGIPYILAVRNTDVNIFFKKMFHLRSIGIKILNNAKSIIFLSESYKDEVLENYIPVKYQKKILTKVVLLPNGIDRFWIDNKPSKSKVKPSEILKLLHVGDININKNLSTTVQAVKLLIEKGFKVQYTAVGKIKDDRVYNELKKEKFVTFISPIPKEKLITIYRENDIFVMPSLKETFGLVYAEAMTQGLPIIYSKGQGFDRQFADGEVGYSVDATNPIDIANKVIKIIDNYEISSTNTFSMVEKFNWDDINEKYLEIYSKLRRGKLS